MINRLIIMLCLLMWAGAAIATPTVKTTVADVKGKYVYLKIVYTSDGTDAAAVDIVAAADSEAKRYIQRGFTAMILNADPDTGGTSPANDTDVIFTAILQAWQSGQRQATPLQRQRILWGLICQMTWASIQL